MWSIPVEFIIIVLKYQAVTFNNTINEFQHGCIGYIGDF